MNILAIDPGTRCGWAKIRDGWRTSGTWDLSVDKKCGEEPGQRYSRLRIRIEEARIGTLGGLDMIAYEDCVYHKGARAAQVYGGLVAVIQMTAAAWGLALMPVNVKTIKAAAGNGNADKDYMIRMARRAWPDQAVKDDNQADALWLLEYAVVTAGGRK